METKIEYRKNLVKIVCKNCVYKDICGLGRESDCEAFRILVRTYENVDSDNPDY